MPKPRTYWISDAKGLKGHWLKHRPAPPTDKWYERAIDFNCYQEAAKALKLIFDENKATDKTRQIAFKTLRSLGEK